jgi:hypothetical protein
VTLPSTHQAALTGYTKEQVLRKILTTDIESFNSEADRHKKIHRYCASSVIGLTAATTITASLGLALGNSYGRAIQFIVVALTATTTAVSAWAEMRKARELWRHEREVEYALKDILRDLNYRSATGPIADNYLDDCFSRAKAIIGSSSSKWARIHERSLESVSTKDNET